MDRCFAYQEDCDRYFYLNLRYHGQPFLINQIVFFIENYELVIFVQFLGPPIMHTNNKKYFDFLNYIRSGAIQESRNLISSAIAYVRDATAAPSITPSDEEENTHGIENHLRSIFFT